MPGSNSPKNVGFWVNLVSICVDFWNSFGTVLLHAWIDAVAVWATCYPFQLPNCHLAKQDTFASNKLSLLQMKKRQHCKCQRCTCQVQMCVLHAMPKYLFAKRERERALCFVLILNGDFRRCFGLSNKTLPLGAFSHTLHR